MKAGLSKLQIQLLKEGPSSTSTGMVAPSDAQRLQEDEGIKEIILKEV